MNIFETMKRDATQLESGLLFLKKDVPERERIHLMMWMPKATKPYFNYLVKPEMVEKTISEADQRLIQHKKSVNNRRESRKPTKEKMKSVEIGQIYYTSWGYEQTNVDFYQVTSVKNAMVGLRPISSKMIKQDSWASGKVVAIKDDFKGEEFFKRANFELGKGSFTITSFSSAWLWEGNPKECSWWG